MDVKGKKVLVTGASRGIGAATARLFAHEGAEVVLVARSSKELEQLTQEIHQQGGKAKWYAADLSQSSEIEKLALLIQAEIGTPDVIVNNAGLGRWLFVEETPAEEAEMMTKLPFQAAFHICRCLLPAMLERGSGYVVNVNSPVAIINWGGAAAYASSRWALRGLSESLKIDLAGTGVKVRHVVLGEVESNYWEANPGARDRLPGISKLIPRLSTEKAAKHIRRSLNQPFAEYTRPWVLWSFRRMLWMTPWLVKGLVRMTSYKRK